jgi:Phytanoyl-CoA dioxygenase (PhyH)
MVMPVLDSLRRSYPGLDPKVFGESGYTIIRGLFEVEEIERLRVQVAETFAEMEQRGRVGTDPGIEGTIRAMDGDLLSIPSLRHVLLDQRIVGAVGELLGGEPVYFGDSSVRMGANGMRAWHRDNVNRRKWRWGPDWHGSYPLLRCGLYMQDHAVHSGGLALRPRSHDDMYRLPTLPKLVESKAGDLIVWNLRTLHCGEVVRLRGASKLPLHPRLQTRLPASLRMPEDRERIVMFMGFAREDPHLEHYLAYLKTRDYMQGAWANSRFGSEVWSEAESAGLRMLRPVSAYGAA